MIPVRAWQRMCTWGRDQGDTGTTIWLMLVAASDDTPGDTDGGQQPCCWPGGTATQVAKKVRRSTVLDTRPGAAVQADRYRIGQVENRRRSR